MAGKIPEIYIQMVAYNPRIHSVDYSSTDLAKHSGNLYSAFHWTGCCGTVSRKQNLPQYRKNMMQKKNHTFAL
jgi:hypothetical protein